jgi:hypothetical protein
MAGRIETRRSGISDIVKLIEDWETADPASPIPIGTITDITMYLFVTQCPPIITV